MSQEKFEVCCDCKRGLAIEIADKYFCSACDWDDILKIQNQTTELIAKITEDNAKNIGMVCPKCAHLFRPPYTQCPRCNIQKQYSICVRCNQSFDNSNSNKYCQNCLKEYGKVLANIPMYFEEVQSEAPKEQQETLQTKIDPNHPEYGAYIVKTINGNKWWLYNCFNCEEYTAVEIEGKMYCMVCDSLTMGLMTSLLSADALESYLVPTGTIKSLLQYQAAVTRTMPTKMERPITDQEYFLLWYTVGLSGESGEVMELAKKGIFHQRSEMMDRNKWLKELGDVLWYLAAICKCFNLTLEEVAQHNIEKLNARYPDGWDKSRASFREGKAE